VKVRRKADGKEFLLYNTHLEFGYHAMHGAYPEELGLMGQTAREKGVALIAEKMQAMAGKKQAVIFCGDMNQMIGDKCFEPLWQMGMIDGRAQAEKCPSEANRNSVTWNGFSFARPDKAPTQESEEKAQGYGNFFMIDHFFIKNCKALEYRTLREKRYKDEPMPADQAYMSDHFPVMLVVRF
jgi:endonuclease/exonuclease/phosphatase family metal-dependent hydrolase